MRTWLLVIELGEKMGLLAAAALVAVLFPPLRKRLLGLGQRRDKMAAMAFGLCLSVWGSMMGFQVLGEHIDIRAIGILIGAILGGAKAGILAGVGGGVFHGLYFGDETAYWGIAASCIDGSIAGYVASRRPRLFAGWRVFVAALLIQAVHTLPLGVALSVAGRIFYFLPAWPAHLVQLLVCALGVTLFVTVARIVVAREQDAVALALARSAANAAALDSLRRRLEPHFLFNALNTLRAAIRTDPVLARNLVSDLADLYRYLLRHPEDAPLGEEVEHACSYLDIEKARLGEQRLEVRRSIPASLAALKVPALLLQPLVENAVKHGVAAKTGPGTVTIRASLAASMLHIEVEDHCEGSRFGSQPGLAGESSGQEPTEAHLDMNQSHPGSGIALATLRERLEKRFDSRASLTMVPQPHGMRVTVELPLPEKERTLGRQTRQTSGPHPALWPAPRPRIEKGAS